MQSFIYISFNLLYMAIFFKLIFIEHILVKRHDDYKTNSIVKESFDVIKQRKFYVLALYLINNFSIMLRVVLTGFFKFERYITFFWVIVQLLVNCVYVMLILIYYGEKVSQKKEAAALEQVII